MRIPGLLALFALAACGDSTDISGLYFGNATSTLSPTSGAGSVHAGSATISIANVGDDVDVTLAPGCALTASREKEETIKDGANTTRFVFTTDVVRDGQTCTLPLAGADLGITIVEGDLVVQAGSTMTLQLGGAIGTAPEVADVGGYAVFDFAGAQP